MESKEWESFSQYLKSKGVVKIGRNVLGVITNLVRESGCSLGYNEIELMWETWQGKSQITPEGFVLVPKVLPSEINDQVWDDYLTPQCVVNEGGFSFISCEDFDLDALYQTLLKAQEQSHD